MTRNHFFVICTGQPSYGEIMARKCSAESSHRATRIVEKEAIVLLFFYFSTSTSFLALVPIFFLRHRFLPSRFQHHYTWRSAVFVWIVSRKREKEREKEKQKESKKGGPDEKREIRGWKERTIVDLPVVLVARETRHCGFMLLIHKFPVNGARMNEHPPFLYPNLPPLSSPCPSSSRFSGLLPLLFFLSFIPFSLRFPYSFGSLFYPGGRILLLRDRSYVYKSVIGHGDDTRRNFRIYWSHGRLLSTVLRRRLVPTFSRKRHGTAGGTLYPINLWRIAFIGGNRAIGYAHYRAISEELFV